MLSKLRHYVTRQPLIQLYYLLVYPFITYTILVMEKYIYFYTAVFDFTPTEVIHIIPFSSLMKIPSTYLKNGLLKLPDLVEQHNSLFMYEYHHNELVFPFFYGQPNLCYVICLNQFYFIPYNHYTLQKNSLFRVTVNFSLLLRLSITTRFNGRLQCFLLIKVTLVNKGPSGQHTRFVYWIIL